MVSHDNVVSHVEKLKKLNGLMLIFGAKSLRVNGTECVKERASARRMQSPQPLCIDLQSEHHGRGWH